MNIAVILASGNGKRMKAGKNKVLLPLDKNPIIYYTISAFEKNPEIQEVVLVVKRYEIGKMETLAAKYGFSKVRAVIAGGKERQDSGHNALQFLKTRSDVRTKDIILFHNGANPFVTQKEISACLREAKKHGACAVAYPTQDTIKVVSKSGMAEKTLERKKLWNMQTPQAIRFDLAWKAFEQAKKRNYLGTDDVNLVEKAGGKVKVIEASAYNFKITNPLDLELAKIILRKKLCSE